LKLRELRDGNKVTAKETKKTYSGTIKSALGTQSAQRGGIRLPHE